MLGNGGKSQNPTYMRHPRIKRKKNLITRLVIDEIKKKKMFKLKKDKVFT